MTFLDDARAVAARGPRCTMGALLEALSATENAEVQEALDDPTIHGSGIARALLARGHKMSAATVNRHRAGDCSC
jgi:hypothetical protein